MTINNRERIGWIDVAKGMAILAIVTIHTGFLPFSKITAPLLSWTLLIFPFIGGCLYKPNPSFIKFIIKKSRRLLLPYYIAGLISFIGWLFLRSHYPQNILLFPIADTALQLLLMQGSIFNGPLWFLPSYFICTSIVEMIYSYWEKRSNKTQLLLIIILTAFSLYLLSLQIIFPYALDISLLFVSFFLFGIYIKQSLFKLTSIKFIIFLVIFFTTSLINGTIDLNQRQLNIYPLFLISVCSGIAVIFYISKWIDKNNNIFIRPLSYLGEKSILLMIIHWPIIQWLSYFLKISSISDKIGANPTLTSFWLPHTNQPIIRVYVFIFLFFYLSIVLLIFYALDLIFSKKLTKKPSMTNQY